MRWRRFRPRRIWPQLLVTNKAGTRLFVTLNFAGQAGKVVMLDITDPENPKEAGIVDLGLNSGPHYLRLTSDESGSWCRITSSSKTSYQAV
jgi:hypothetical protein